MFSDHKCPHCKANVIKNSTRCRCCHADYSKPNEELSCLGMGCFIVVVAIAGLFLLGYLVSQDEGNDSEKDVNQSYDSALDVSNQSSSNKKDNLTKQNSRNDSFVDYGGIKTVQFTNGYKVIHHKTGKTLKTVTGYSKENVRGYYAKSNTRLYVNDYNYKLMKNNKTFYLIEKLNR